MTTTTETITDTDDGMMTTTTTTTVKVPRTTFRFDYNEPPEPTGTLEIVHVSSDPIPADQLTVSGENLGRGNTGTWKELGGDASARMDGAPAVVPGDILTLRDVPPNYEVQLRYTGPGTPKPQWEDSGPDA